MHICYINYYTAAQLSSCTDKAIVRGTRIDITNQWIISFHIVSLRAWGLITGYEIREIRECLNVGVVGRLDGSAPFFRMLRRYTRDIRVKFVVILRSSEVKRLERETVTYTYSYDLYIICIPVMIVVLLFVLSKVKIEFLNMERKIMKASDKITYLESF